MLKEWCIEVIQATSLHNIAKKHLCIIPGRVAFIDNINKYFFVLFHNNDNNAHYITAIKIQVYLGNRKVEREASGEINQQITPWMSKEGTWLWKWLYL